jgi:hypothetical protein
MADQAIRGRMALALAGLLGVSCTAVRLPYPVGEVKALPRPAHGQRVAVLPFEDRRSADEGPDRAELFVYRGISYHHTDLERLPSTPGRVVAELVARHLAHAGVFTQVILVERAEDAPEADLILSGAITRARGYLEADRPKEEGPNKGPAPERRWVMAEVVLADLSLREARAPKRALLEADVGWSIAEERPLLPGLDPWAVLGEALYVSVGQLIELAANADLEGGYVVREKVRLELDPIPRDRAATVTGTVPGDAFGALSSGPPPGWRFEADAPGIPIGWLSRSDKQPCVGAHLVEPQTQHFHRLLGPYHPMVRIWACPADAPLTVDVHEEFPASYLGTRFDGLHYFAHRLGQTNWPGAAEQIAEHLGVEPPSSPYVWKVGPPAPVAD